MYFSYPLIYKPDFELVLEIPILWMNHKRVSIHNDK